MHPRGSLVPRLPVSSASGGTAGSAAQMFIVPGPPPQPVSSVGDPQPWILLSPGSNNAISSCAPPPIIVNRALIKRLPFNPSGCTTGHMPGPDSNMHSHYCQIHLTEEASGA